MRNRILLQIAFGLVLLGILIVCSISVYGQIISAGITNMLTRLFGYIVCVVMALVLLKMVFSSMEGSN